MDIPQAVPWAKGQPHTGDAAGGPEVLRKQDCVVVFHGLVLPSHRPASLLLFFASGRVCGVRLCRRSAGRLWRREGLGGGERRDNESQPLKPMSLWMHIYSSRSALSIS